jgi:hypothetical protein
MHFITTLFPTVHYFFSSSRFLHTPSAYILAICVEKLVSHVYTDTGIFTRI